MSLFKLRLCLMQIARIALIEIYGLSNTKRTWCVDSQKHVSKRVTFKQLIHSRWRTKKHSVWLVVRLNVWQRLYQFTDGQAIGQHWVVDVAWVPPVLWISPGDDKDSWNSTTGAKLHLNDCIALMLDWKLLSDFVLLRFCDFVVRTLRFKHYFKDGLE